MSNLANISEELLKSKKITFNERTTIKNLTGRRQELFLKAINNKSYDYWMPEDFCKKLCDNKRNIDIAIFKRLSLFLELDLGSWIDAAYNSNLIDLIIQYIQSIVDLNRPSSDPVYKEEDVIDIYQCIWFITSTRLNKKLVKKENLANLLFFSIVPNYTKLFSLILQTVTYLINDEKNQFYGPLIAAMNTTARLQHSPSIFKWIIDTLDPSRGIPHLNAVLDFLHSILLGSQNDVRTLYFFESIMLSDGLKDAMKLISPLLHTSDDRKNPEISSFSGYYQYLDTFLNENQQAVKNIFGINEFDPLDSISGFKRLKKFVNNDSTINSFILSLIDISSRCKDVNVMKTFNTMNLFVRIGMKNGYSFQDSLTKAVQLATDQSVSVIDTIDKMRRKVSKRYDKNNSSMNNNINYNNYDKMTELSSQLHEYCDWTNFDYLPKEPKEMKNVPSLSEGTKIRRELNSLSQQFAVVNYTMNQLSEKLQKYDNKLKSILNDDDYSDFLDELSNSKVNDSIEDSVKSQLNSLNENENDTSNIAQTLTLEQLAVPPPPPPPPPPGSNTQVKVIIKTPEQPYPMQSFAWERVKPDRVSTTVWGSIVPNQFNEINWEIVEPYMKLQEKKGNNNAGKINKLTEQKNKIIVSQDVEQSVVSPIKKFSKACGDFKRFVMELRFDKEDFKEEYDEFIKADKENGEHKFDEFYKGVQTAICDTMPPICREIIKFSTKGDKKYKLDEFQLLLKDIPFDSPEMTPTSKILKMLVSIPNLRERFMFFNFIFFTYPCVDKQIDLLTYAEKACEQIRNSTKFKAFLELVLKVGNTMNSIVDSSKMKRGGSQGFKIDYINRFQKEKQLGLYILMKNSPSANDFICDLEKFPFLTSFSAANIESELMIIVNEYNNLLSAINAINWTDKKDPFYIRWEAFQNENSEKIRKLPTTFVEKCEKMFDVIDYFDYAEEKNDNSTKVNMFKKNCGDFFRSINEIIKQIKKSENIIATEEAKRIKNEHRMIIAKKK